MEGSPVNVVVSEPKLLIQNPEPVLVIPPWYCKVEAGPWEFPATLQNLKYKPR
jgi:hypothetical protein